MIDVEIGAVIQRVSTPSIIEVLVFSARWPFSDLNIQPPHPGSTAKSSNFEMSESQARFEVPFLHSQSVPFRSMSTWPSGDLGISRTKVAPTSKHSKPSIVEFWPPAVTKGTVKRMFSDIVFGLSGNRGHVDVAASPHCLIVFDGKCR